MKINPKLIGLVLVVLAVLLAIAILGAALGSFSARKDYSPYSAVYLSNGDMYFGVLSWMPKPHLSNVWLLQRQVDGNNQPQFSVAQFTKAFWSPVDQIFLNPKQIVWWSRLRNDSQLVKAMSDPSLFQQEQQTAPQTNSFQGPSTQSPGSNK